MNKEFGVFPITLVITITIAFLETSGFREFVGKFFIYVIVSGVAIAIWEILYGVVTDFFNKNKDK